MALSAFDDKTHTPQDAELAEMLGRTSRLWEDLRTHVAGEYASVTESWVFSGQKYGWALRLKSKKRTVLYMIPCRRHFLAAVVFGEKAVRAAHQSDLPASVLEAIDSATKYAEGRGIRLPVRNKQNVATFKKLAAIKMAN